MTAHRATSGDGVPAWGAAYQEREISEVANHLVAVVNELGAAAAETQPDAAHLHRTVACITGAFGGLAPVLGQLATRLTELSEDRTLCDDRAEVSAAATALATSGVLAEARDTAASCAGLLADAGAQLGHLHHRRYS